MVGVLVDEQQPAIWFENWVQLRSGLFEVLHVVHDVEREHGVDGFDGSDSDSAVPLRMSSPSRRDEKVRVQSRDQQVTLIVPSPTSTGGGLLPSLGGCFCMGPE